MNVNFLKQSTRKIISSEKSTSEKLQCICNLLESQVDYYDWVGFYFRSGNREELKLAEFTGEPTEHNIIPFGRGICGQVALSNKNFVVQDVSKQNNYISCNWKVKSEIVVPIFVDSENIGQIDVDSHTINPFTDKDEKLLEFICEKVASLYSSY